MNALIGYTGLVGSALSAGIDFDVTYNSSNIDQIQHCEFDTVYCAAPSGNRLLANQQPDWDTNSVCSLVNNLRTISADKFVLISTVDTVHAPESVYGNNRRMLEHFVLTQFEQCYVIRLCTLIHLDISKNLLFDIKHARYLDRINSDVVRQYYPLSRLCADIDTVLLHDVREINLVSEPVSDQEIVDRFCPDIVTISMPAKPYDLQCRAPFDKYVLSKQQVFEQVAEYLND